MGHQAFQLHFQQDRPLAAGVVDGLAGDLVGSQQVQAVHDDAGEAVSFGPIGHVANGHLHALGHGNGVTVVLADENHGQLVDAGEVHGFVGLALAGGAVAEIHERNPSVTLHFAGQGVPHGLGEAGSNHVGKLDDVVLQVGALEGELAGVAIGVALLAHKGQHYLGGSKTGAHL